MNSAVEKLIKILKLESQRKFDNRSVIGGLAKFTVVWREEAILQNTLPKIVNTVVTSLQNYQDLPISQRENQIEFILNILRDDQNPNQQIIEKSTSESSTILVSTFDNKNTQQKEVESRSSIPEKKLSINPGLFEIEKALSKSVINVNGIGKNKAEALSRIGIQTIKDLLYYFPRKHEDFSVIKQINQLVSGEIVSVAGTVSQIYTRNFKGGKQSFTEIILEDGTGKLRIIYFNQPYIGNTIRVNAQLIVSGKIEMYLGRHVLNNPEWAEIDNSSITPNRLLPYYPLTKSITQKWLRGIIFKQLMIWVPKITDFYYHQFLENAELLDLQSALFNAHFPENQELLEKAEERFAFQDTFFLHLAMLKQKKDWQGVPAKEIVLKPHFIKDITESLPYSLTKAQLGCINDILDDFANKKPMSRLIQGDVGSGKTIVSAIIVALVIDNGYQSVVMAPTSILAEQLFVNIRKFLLENKIINEQEICFLSGDTPAKDKENIRVGLASGKIKVAIGTHALIEEPVQFKNLEFVVIDEQHRFGVMQRKNIREKGKSSHLLVMTATPIPRSLALTIYGDLDLSIIDELPPGRKEIKTTIINPNHRHIMYSLIRNQVANGNQAFIVYPLVEIDDDEAEDTKAAVNEFERLKKDVFPELRLGLLHGRMKAEDKEKTMNAFRVGNYDILVSTTVIEVGVDISNATIMAIEGANRFGLSQLHQLRGRVGRGESQSYCILIPENEDAIENQRLKAMVETTDGFRLAEIDLQQRGPGDFIGIRQSGYKEIRFSTIMNAKLIDKARKFALDFLENNPDLINVDSYFYQLIENEYRQKMIGVKN